MIKNLKFAIWVSLGQTIELRLEKKHIITSFVNSKQLSDTDSKGKTNSL